MSVGALLEIDARHNKSGYSIFLREQVQELSSGWPSQVRPLFSDRAPDLEILQFSAERARTQRRSLLARAGGGLTIQKVASLLRIQARDVDRLRVRQHLLAVPNPDSEGWLYPACQFEDRRVVPGLDEVIPEFAVSSPWTRLYVLTSNEPALSGRSPIEALRDGDLEAVRQLVRGYGQQGAA
jgi:hypothetical protein